ncbi:MAG: chemotaxis protein CheC [Nanobdellota archaeon]
MKKYNDMQVDALGEVANVGIGNAATALSQLIGKDVTISLPDTKLIPLERFAEEVGGAEKIIRCLYLKVTGDMKGQALFLFPEEDALNLVKLVMGEEAKEMDEMAISSFKEMSNVIVGSYLTAIGDMLDMKVMPEPPLMATDMAQAVLDSIVAGIGKTADQILSIKTTIEVDGFSVNGSFILVFEEQSLDIMLESLEKKYGMGVN